VLGLNLSGALQHPEAIFLSTGMCLQAFVEAFFFLAQRKFKTRPLHEQVASLIDLCEYHLSLLDEKRLVYSGTAARRRARPLIEQSSQETLPAAQPAGGSPPPCMIGAKKLSHSGHALS
jgi:tubulin polyglutamylase TTLL11